MDNWDENQDSDNAAHGICVGIPLGLLLWLIILATIKELTK